MKKIVISILLAIITHTAFTQKILTLEECREMALKNNVGMQNAELSVEIAKQQKKEAFTQYFPSVSATGVGFGAHKPMMQMDMDISGMMQPLMEMLVQMMPPGEPMPEMSSGPTKIDALKNGVIGGVMATQPIYAGGQILTGNRLAQAGIEVRQLQKQMTDNQILLTTENYFWQIALLKEKMKTIDDAITMLNRIFSDEEIAADAGLTTRNDLLRVELEQNKLASNKLKVENGIRILKTTFAQHIGLENNNFDIETPDIENIQLFAQQDNPSVENRPEYKLLDKSVDIARMQVDMEIGKNLPTVAIGAGYQYMNFDINKSNGIKNDFGMLFATVSIPITNWWGGSHAIKRKKLELKTAENERREKTDLLSIQMQQVRNELNESFQQVLIAKKSITTAEENLRISEDNFNAGITTLSDLLESQNLVQQSRDQYTEAAATYFVKMVEYKQMSY